MTAPPAFVAHAVSHPGHHRGNNEDCFLIEPELGLYLVLDGMGGHSAGDVASALGRDAIRDQVRAGRGRLAPRDLLEGAIRAASRAIHARAQRHREQHGMGTTMVGCLALDGGRVLVAHVGDSRAYLQRGGALTLLTVDHTVVAELVARGGLTAEEAERHPYKAVLSRNLGSKPDCLVDVREVALEPGDRLLLCSDGLNGYAAHHAMEQVMASAADPRRAADDLVELALRGGGGDNVTCLVVATERAAEAESTLILRRDAAAAWARRREAFLAAARARGVARSPICALLSPDEAIAIVVGNLFEAITHDLEQTTGIYVWTFAENLAGGWLDQGGGFAALRAVLDLLEQAAGEVIADVEAEQPGVAPVLEAAVVRALMVGEMALASVIGERLRAIEEALATVQGDDALIPTADERTVRFERGELATSTPTPTAPSLPVAPAAPAGPAVVACLVAARGVAEARAGRTPGGPEIAACVGAAHRAAIEDAGSPAGSLGPAIRELLGGRSLTEAALRPLFASLDRARQGHLAAARAVAAGDEVRLAAIHRLGAAHQALHAEVAVLVADAAAEAAEAVRALAGRTALQRVELDRGEVRLSHLEREARATTVTERDAGRAGAEPAGEA